MNRVPKGYRLLRIGEKFVPNFYARHKEGGLSNNLGLWIYYTNQPTDMRLLRIHAHYFLVPKQPKEVDFIF